MSVAFRTAESTRPGTLRDQLQRWLVTAGNDQPLNSGKKLFHLPRANTFVEGLPDCPKQRALARLLGNTWDVKVVRCFYYGLLESIGQPNPASFFDTVADIDADLTIADPVRGAFGQDPAGFRGHLPQAHPGTARVVGMAVPSPS